MEQWTKAKTENKKNRKIMKKMKTTILTSVALAACVSTQLFAQNSKEDTIAFSLALQGQASVSTSASKANAGYWTDGPLYYKTGKGKLTQTDLIKAIGVVLHGNTIAGDQLTGANYYSSKAQLVLVQGELSGFFNVIPGLSTSIPDPDMDGTFSTDPSTGVSTIIPDATVTYATLANGRHYQPNLAAPYIYPPGHFQPWGQIFIKDPANTHQTGIVCENVTFFFDLQVQECYDCFYLNSFISDATFNYSKTGGNVSGPPCCVVPAGQTLFGKGTDRYYLTWKFDNTQANEYLDGRNTGSPLFTGYYGLQPTIGFLDGTKPDALAYNNSIVSGQGRPSPYEIRFTLNGILTYGWQLKKINSGDLLPDFIGNATYAANGYGFVQLTCQLITGTATITEKVVKTALCCDDVAWYDNWYGIGWDGNADDLVIESNPPGIEGLISTSQENVPLSLSYHTTDWPNFGTIDYSSPLPYAQP